MRCSSAEKPRQALIATAKMLVASGLIQGTAGNLSARVENGFLITPTGMPCDQLAPEHIVEMRLDGGMDCGQLKPSSEWRMHRDILVARPEVSAIIHVHSPYATALACARREIPAFHYMVATAGGRMIPCAGYAPFGTQELSDQVLSALVSRQACLMANHGMIALGEDLEAAFRLAREVEYLARLYCTTLQIGGPVVLSEEAMSEVEERFKSYGKQSEL
jgi:L-fuculose-phosphate aldolase